MSWNSSVYKYICIYFSFISDWEKKNPSKNKTCWVWFTLILDVKYHISKILNSTTHIRKRLAANTLRGNWNTVFSIKKVVIIWTLELHQLLAFLKFHHISISSSFPWFLKRIRREWMTPNTYSTSKLSWQSVDIINVLKYALILCPPPPKTMTWNTQKVNTCLVSTFIKGKNSITVVCQIHHMWLKHTDVIWYDIF